MRRKIIIVPIIISIAFSMCFSGCEKKNNESVTSESVVDDNADDSELVRELKEKACDGFVIEDGKLIAYVGNEKDITIPESVNEICKNALSGDLGYAENLEEITVPGNVKIIDKNAFAFCSAKIIRIEEGVEEIEDFAFSDSYISEIFFSKSITKIGKCIMETEEGLEDCKIHVESDSVVAEYFEKNMPYGSVELIYK